MLSLRLSRFVPLTLCRKLNTSPSTIEDKDILKLQLINPPVKKIDLHFPLGLEVTARNMKGVTIKDALDAIYKQFKKKVGNSYVTIQNIGADKQYLRLMMSWTSPTSLVSSGTKKSAGHALSSTRPSRVRPHLLARSPRRRPRRMKHRSCLLDSNVNLGMLAGPSSCIDMIRLSCCF